MGFDKAVIRIGTLAPLERISLVLGRRASAVVVPTRLQDVARTMMPRSRIVLNDEPTRGMTHSLRLALRDLSPNEPFGVLLGDMPAMTESTIARTERLLEPHVDVAFPTDRKDTPGHPVLFSARTRAIVEALPEGDTLRAARYHASLVRATWICTDASAFLDLDVAADWYAFGA